MVDDESRMRKLVNDFLSRKNYEVIEAGDGEEAIDKFYADKDIALVILEYREFELNKALALPNDKEYTLHISGSSML